MSYTFFSQFLKQMGQVGSVLPSSRFLASSICNQIDFGSVANIVELGPGTGSLTKLLLPRMTEQARLLCVEQNNVFAEQLGAEVQDSRFLVVQGEAQDLEQHLVDVGMGPLDCVVSSLPLSNIPLQTKMQILQACRAQLKPAGQFVQYQYSLIDRNTVKRYFTLSNMDFVLMNFPPAFVYSCVR